MTILAPYREGALLPIVALGSARTFPAGQSSRHGWRALIPLFPGGRDPVTAKTMAEIGILAGR